MNSRLSAVLAIRTDYSRARRLLHCLQQQSLSGLELVMVAPQRILDQVAQADIEGIAFRPVVLERMRTGAQGWALGAQHASAPWLVLVEDHCFPEKGWAEALLQAAENPEVLAVGPRLVNGNPATLWSRVEILLNFSEFLGCSAGKRTRLCGHNTCYRRTVLPEGLQLLEEAFESEAAFHERLGGRGGWLQFEPRAVVHHVNISRALAFFKHKFLGGALFGGARSRTWSLKKRALYTLGSPLIPFLRTLRLLPILRSSLLDTLEWGRWPGALVLLGAALICHGLGEAAGYIMGHANSSRLYALYSGLELDRYSNLADFDRHLLESL